MTLRFFRRLTPVVPLLVAMAAGSAWADTYPSKPIRLVSPYSAGGGNDLIARAIAVRLGNVLKQPIIVENREGGGGNIGTNYVAKAAPDGYTLLMTAQSLTMRPALFRRELPFDVQKDFIPLGIVGSFPLLFLAKPGQGFTDIPSLIAYSKAHPDKLTYATPGIGTTQHVAVELFKAQTGAKLLHIPYKGASKAVLDALSGTVSLLSSTPSSVMQYVAAGKLLLLGTGEKKRDPALANAPTIGETVPDYSVNNWLGLMAPANTPRSIVDTLDKALVQICQDPDFIRELAEAGFSVRSQNAESMAKQVDSDLRKWGDVIVKSNIRAE